jgi:rhodanese-related sulfurtransferase
MNKLIITILGIIILVGGYFYFSANNSNDYSKNGGEIKSINSGTGVLEVEENDFDFGEILMDGGLMKHNFTVKNIGDGPVTIKSAKTSCMCTTANIFDADGKKAGPFGMGGRHGANPNIDMEVLPGEEITVEAIYDPLAHGPDATGKLVREIFLNTDSKKEVSLKFRGEGVKQFSRVQGPSLEFDNKEYDYGVVKQSEGIIETKFELVNNGNEIVIVDSLPASCACTEATIDKKEIKVGERATITVAFDANLHPEPKGRFFKTIEVVSNIKPSPELKIYANVDYDLGMDKLKLQEHEGIDEHTKDADGHDGLGFSSISSAELEKMLKNKDFTLIDVHTPEQKHIPGTDFMISYDEVDKIESVIPSKNSKVVLYCRSGGMSKQTAKELAKRGYRNVFELENGLNEWLKEGKEVLPKNSVIKK